MGIATTRPLLQRMDRFLYSPAYFVLLGVLTVLSNVFGQERFIYPCIILIGMYVCLLGRDFLPLMPILYHFGKLQTFREKTPNYQRERSMKSVWQKFLHCYH